MTVNDSGQYDTETPAGRAKIVGVGKAGCTIADRIAGEWKNPPVVVAISTNGRVLTNSRCPVRLQIGKSITRGLGAGGDPEIGRQAAHKDLPLITELFADTDLVFVIVGLGGGTGTGAGPAVIRAAHEAGAMTLSVAALPFEFEGAGVRSCAQAGLRNLLEATDVGVVVPNDSVVGENSGDVPLKKAFEMAD